MTRAHKKKLLENLVKARRVRARKRRLAKLAQSITKADNLIEKATEKKYGSAGMWTAQFHSGHEPRISWPDIQLGGPHGSAIKKLQAHRDGLDAAIRILQGKGSQPATKCTCEKSPKPSE